jgi:subtilisin family serine protease
MICAAGFASSGDDVPGNSCIESDVYAELRGKSEESVYVVVLLEEAPKVKNAQTPAKRRQAVKEIQSSVLKGLPSSEFAVVHKYDNFASMTGYVNSAGLARLATDPKVKSVGLDVGGHGHLNVSVPFIEADRVHTELLPGFTGEGMTVAVLDSGIDSDHPDLADNIADGWYHFLRNDYGPGAEDDHGHGTNVTGIITSKGVVASIGVAPDADILPVKVLDSSNSFQSSSDIAAAVDYVVTHKADYANLSVMNMSLGTGRRFTECPCDNVSLTWLQNLKASLDAARDAGIVIFASSGNQGSTTEMPAPACLSSVVAVAAVYDQNLGREPDSGTYNSNFGSSWPGTFDAETYPDLITTFSNRNGCNELAAPGRRIRAPGRGGGTSNYTGTSMASPHCAGVAALMHQKAESVGAPTSPASIVHAMKDTGLPTVDSAATSPNPIRVDAFAAVSSFLDDWTGFTWKQMPDNTFDGMDVACDVFDNPGPPIQRRIADDFPCTTTGPITEVVLYQSWKADSSAAIENISLSIYSDIPDPDGRGPEFSKPGDLLWQKEFNGAQGEFAESLHDTIPAPGRVGGAWWWDPAANEAPVQYDHLEIWRYDIPINKAEAFVQQGDPSQPREYWLAVHVTFDESAPVEGDPGLGWKTTPPSQDWNDAAVYSNDGGVSWSRLLYPAELPSAYEPLDLAFEIRGEICCCCPDYAPNETITFEDYAGFANEWGWTGPSGGDMTDKDLNCDGVVDYQDISIFARLWLTDSTDQCRGCF